MFSAKKLLFIGFFIILLIAIPLTIFLVQQQQETRSQAQAATTLAFTPPSTQASPMEKSVGDVFGIDVTVDPSSNLVSFVRLEIQYDSTKLATASADEGSDPFVPNTAAFPSINEGPIYEDGKILVTLSVGSDPTKAIQTPTRVGTITFKALEETDTPTLVTYGVQTQVLSLGGEDQASENVLSTTTPAAIQIGGGEITPTVTEEPEPTDITPTITVTPTASPTAAANIPPVCTAFTPSVASGSAPLAVTFTTRGDDEDGRITKIAYNFGEQSVVNITEGLNASNVENQTTHTYNNGGTFTASAVLTDDRGGTNTNTASCSATIVVAGPTATPSASTTPTATPTTIAGTDTPTPTMESPGPGATIIGLGAFFTVLSLVGAVLFFAL